MDKDHYALITDIGSTTTKAVLIDIDATNLVAIEHADTTVEAPFNDVRIGVFNSIKAIEQKNGITLLTNDASSSSIQFVEGIKYYSTSSAGGGLQILVIGLTLFDSASSAKRAAYGAGGIILDVFAINDNRSSIEQMLAMRNLRPDMILLSGGTDGGAISSVLRLAEILRIAKPMPKFSTNVKIPTIFAGNNSTVDLITRMISNDFDLHILPNLRPSMQTENLKPTRDKIQEIFMENVMERAPGYSSVKKLVHAPILPTPNGVMNTLKLMDETASQKAILFDIGGATTDVFTHLHTHFQRTVSANLGMSYSALNVMKESGIESLLKLLPPTISEECVRNYIGNKTLYPTQIPHGSKEQRIEHALAKCAIMQAYIQHQDMHYSKEKVGYLDALKAAGKDKFEAKFNYIANEESFHFYPSDIELIIGAGGVFANASNSLQCADILISGFKPVGITKLAIDKHFISPHLGVLSCNEDHLARNILNKECVKYLALHIRPIFPNNKKHDILQLEYDGIIKTISANDLLFIPEKNNRNLRMKAFKKCMITGDISETSIVTDLPIIVDTRSDLDAYDERMDKLLNLYQVDDSFSQFSNTMLPQDSEFSYDVELPYNGDIIKQVGDKVYPEDVVAQNLYNPPRLFVVNTNPDGTLIPEPTLKEAIVVQAGQEVTFSETIRLPLPEYGLRNSHHSPVRGKVEYLDYKTGIVILSEIQRYSTKPSKIDLSSELQIPPKRVKHYVIKKLGDFVYEGDTLAKIMKPNKIRTAISPNTGHVTDFNSHSGMITIQYKSNPYNYKAHVEGIVRQIEDKKAVRISYYASRLYGSIGWGYATHGTLVWLSNSSDSCIPENSIVVIPYRPSYKDLEQIKQNAKGIIFPSINQGDLIQYLGFEQGVINTGQENIPASIVLINGFGEIPFSSNQEKFFKDNVGKLCMISPHTRIRAGVVRASINVIKQQI
ncbi:MAG: glutamate mutase L [Candidatus Cloacimonetes bacterium]|jgi:uncharacterized protein (TIGR01319 family)|nr:glutamate mutase L [Candidatus Cloacimonadota bacterium]MDD4686766.1 glutamate mutase L [Candidatus Cloacimonadota bacterium]MDY0299824.1 glutamate mutase L [Candidatus Cloacimonadaceae bacterium]